MTLVTTDPLTIRLHFVELFLVVSSLWIFLHLRKDLIFWKMSSMGHLILTQKVSGFCWFLVRTRVCDKFVRRQSTNCRDVPTLSSRLLQSQSVQPMTFLGMFCLGSLGLVNGCWWLFLVFHRRVRTVHSQLCSHPLMQCLLSPRFFNHREYPSYPKLGIL